MKDMGKSMVVSNDNEPAIKQSNRDLSVFDDDTSRISTKAKFPKDTSKYVKRKASKSLINSDNVTPKGGTTKKSTGGIIPFTNVMHKVQEGLTSILHPTSTFNQDSIGGYKNQPSSIDIHETPTFKPDLNLSNVHIPRIPFKEPPQSTKVSCI